MSTAGDNCKISILVPVLNRPANAQKVVDSIRANTTVEHEIVFICSPHDIAEQDACVATGARVIAIQWEPGPGDGGMKWNAGFGLTDSEFCLLAADDLEFTPNWDIEALVVAERTGAGVIGTQDDANPTVKRGKHSTHSLVRRSYIDEVGGTFLDGPHIVYHEGYFHQFVDTELCKAAMDRGEWAFARRSVVRHHHPFFDKTVKMDSTYRKALGDASHDSALYKQRLQEWTRQRRTTVI